MERENTMKECLSVFRARSRVFFFFGGGGGGGEGAMSFG